MLAFRLSALIFVAAGCQTLVGIEDSPLAKPDAGAGAIGGGGASGAGGSGGAGGGGTSGSSGVSGTAGAPDAGCGSAQWPAPPTTAAPGAALDLIFAVRELDFGDRKNPDGPSWQKLGYDLDERCTCGDDLIGSCPASDKPMCDGLDGRDNAVGVLLYDLRHTFQITALDSNTFSAGIENGGRTVLVRISDYNGTSDDAQVRVGWYSAAKFGGTPSWDGNDEWPIFSASLAPQTSADGGVEYSLDKPKYFDDAAYVSGGTLVANIPEGVVALADNITIRFSVAFLTGRIEQVAPGQWRLEQGMLAGISRSRDALATLPSVSFGNQAICTDHAGYPLLKARICEYADMHSAFSFPNTLCDALSLGIGLRGHPAKFGPISVVPEPTSPCAPGKDPADDACPQTK